MQMMHAMFSPTDKRLYLPSKDRPHWQSGADVSLSLSYLAWGRRDFSQEFLPECMHEGWVATIIEEGHPVMQIQGVEVELSPRAMIIVGPDCSFGWPTKAGSTCKFVQWMWRDYGESGFGGLARDAHFIRDLPRGKIQPLRENHDQCRREALGLNEQSADYFNACRVLFEILLKRVIASQGSADLAQVRVQQAHEWMLHHLDSKEPVARLCDYLDVSQSTLHRLFKSQMQESAVAHFHRLRMEEARRLLVEQGDQIKSVAITLGYNHLNDFSRAYKSHFGRSPSQVRSILSR